MGMGPLAEAKTLLQADDGHSIAEFKLDSKIILN